MPRETIDSGGEYQEISVPVGPQDRELFETLGCAWPCPEDESAWLSGMNDLISENDVGSREAVMEARRTFWSLLGSVRGEAIEHNTRYNIIPSPARGVDLLRYAHGRGIDVVRFCNLSACLNFSPLAVERRLQAMESLGFDSLALVNHLPMVVGFTPRTLQRRLRVMHAAARLWGWEPDAVREVVQSRPDLTVSRPERLRILAQIATRTCAPMRYPPNAGGQIHNVNQHRLEETMAAYLERQTVITTPAGLHHQAAAYERWPLRALHGLIMQHPGDPVVRRYMRDYPVPDEDDARDAYQTYVEAFHTRGITSLRIDSQLPTMIGEATLPSYDAFRLATETPRLTEQEVAYLDDAITRSLAASNRLRAEAETDADVDERTHLEAEVELGEHARQTLIYRHLYLCIGYAARQGKFTQHMRADMLGAANEALVRAAQGYVPREDVTFVDDADFMIRHALRGERKNLAEGQ